MSKIVSFDFDGTLAVTKWPEIIRPIQPVVEYAKQCKANGDQIILNTMREGVRLQDAVDWCREQGIEFDAVNDNVQCMQEFYGNNPRKIFANEYIDDHNLVFAGIGNSNRRNLDKYAAVLCEQFSRSDPCVLGADNYCDYCELLGICSNPDKLLAFMMQPADEDDQQLLQEPQGTE